MTKKEAVVREKKEKRKRSEPKTRAVLGLTLDDFLDIPVQERDGILDLRCI